MTKIEWCDESWNPITGCTPISEGCKNCYAKRMSYRMKGRFGYDKNEPFKVTYHKDKLKEPLKWKKPKKIFVCSMGDLFHEAICDEAIDDVLSIALLAKQHTYLLLTKRPKRALAYFNYHFPIGVDGNKEFYRKDYLTDNVWVGITAENQERADERIPVLFKIPAKIRFISAEPMLRMMLLEKYLGYYNKYAILTEEKPKLDWVICGGENGHGARAIPSYSIMNLRDQCVKANVPFFFKGWGKASPNTGRKIQGKEWNQFPKIKG